MDSFISWIGGKKLLRKRIIELLPCPRSRYIEVFGGAGWVLFGKDKTNTELEVYNDIDGNLVNLFRCAKWHATELERYIIPLNSRELFFDDRARMDLRGQTDIQRAADYYMMIRTSYGSNRREFSCNRAAITHGLAMLPAVQRRLEKVVIEHRDFSSLIKTYDRPDAVFYCDPPYHGTEKCYDAPFGTEKHIQLRDTLRSIKGRFILSYNDDPFVRDLYKDFKIEAVFRCNNLANRYGGDIFKEIIITNY